jgi:putative serine protease PepD
MGKHAYRLQIQIADGKSSSFEERRVYRIGRAEDADIVLASRSVSRFHAELRPTDTGWDLYDTGSRWGTWVDNQHVMNTTLGATTYVRFGAKDDGVNATIMVDQPQAASGAASDDQTTGQVHDPQPASADPQAASADPQATYVYGQGQSLADRPTGGLLIRTRDGAKRFDSDKSPQIGRDPASDVVADDPVVSRHHAGVERRADSWWFVDRSQSGSYIDGKPVTEKEIAEETVIQLGHPAAGYEITLVPVADIAAAQKTISVKRRRATLGRVAAAVGVVAVVGGVAAAVLLSGKGAQQNTLSSASLDRAKRASVQIIAVGADGRWLWKGSGTIIGADGLILTNAHVAKPTAKGLLGADLPDQDAAIYEVAFAKDDETPAAPKYRATAIVSDGYLDLAVMKINANADGTPIESGKLALPEPVPIGDSNALHTGDHITALGYPGLTADEHVAGPLTVTSGDVSSFKRDYATNTERFWIDTTERIVHGNSGGASINNAGELIGVNTQFLKRSDDPAASYLIRPIALAADIIRIARNGGDPNYVSPYLDKIQHLPAAASATSSGWDKGESVNGDSIDCSPARDQNQYNQLTGVHEGDVVRAKFQLTGIPDDTPLSVTFVDDQGKVLDSTEALWSGGQSQKCISPSFKITPGLTRVVALFVVGYQGELRVSNRVEFG